MYGVLVTYINVFSMKQRMETIELDGQFFKTEKDIYLQALSMALDKVGIDEELDIFRLVYC